LLGEVDLFHFSGHSNLLSGKPEKSGLLLSDGLLTLSELERTLSPRAPALIFLSSCQSGTEDSTLRDALNLSSVFLLGGSRAVIGTSWRVPDSVAALTARKFYETLGTTDAVAAMKNVYSELIKNPEIGAYWSTFRLQGWTWPTNR
jgi:CHAT domain-containing protein